jgi:hypothetical protein
VKWNEFEGPLFTLRASAGVILDAGTFAQDDKASSLAGVATGVPEPLAWVVERCLAKDPNDRYGSTRDLALNRSRRARTPTPSGVASARSSRTWRPSHWGSRRTARSSRSRTGSSSTT